MRLGYEGGEINDAENDEIVEEGYEPRKLNKPEEVYEEQYKDSEQEVKETEMKYHLIVLMVRPCTSMPIPEL